MHKQPSSEESCPELIAFSHDNQNIESDPVELIPVKLIDETAKTQFDSKFLTEKILTEDEEDILGKIIEDKSKKMEQLSLLSIEEISKICLNNEALVADIDMFNQFAIYNKAIIKGFFSLVGDINNSLKEIVNSINKTTREGQEEDSVCEILFSILKDFQDRLYVSKLKKEFTYFNHKKSLESEESEYMTMEEIKKIQYAETSPIYENIIFFLQRLLKKKLFRVIPV